MVRVLAQYTRDPWFESKLRFDFSPPATFGIKQMSHFLNSQSLGTYIHIKEGEYGTRPTGM